MAAMEDMLAAMLDKLLGERKQEIIDTVVNIGNTLQAFKEQQDRIENKLDLLMQQGEQSSIAERVFLGAGVIDAGAYGTGEQPEVNWNALVELEPIEATDHDNGSSDRGTPVNGRELTSVNR